VLGRRGAHLIAFPEMMLTGYPAEDLVLRRSFVDASAALVGRLAARLAAEGLGDLAVIVGFDLLFGSKQRRLSGTVVRAGQWIAGFAVAPCVWQLIDFLARARGTVLFRSEITHQPTTYFGEALYQIHGGKQSEVVFGPLPYLQWYVAYQGWILAALLALGMVLALRLRSFAWLAALCPVVVPYLLYIWAPIIVPRNLAATVPFTAILIAAALVLAVRRVATSAGFLARARVAGPNIGSGWRSAFLASERGTLRLHARCSLRRVTWRRRSADHQRDSGLLFAGE